MMPRERFQKQSLGALYSRIKECRVLLVGAGGIGCELLKNLVLVGFGEIHIIDLDTIDLSNLNRQFLFRHEHIKKSKALVAKETAGRFNPDVRIEAHHANVKDPQFNIDWFKTFSVVFNALDNLEARRHVNRMCLAADVPFIESGTTGFQGQVQPIKKGRTECYDCSTKETPKTFPICTIRSTPSQPIHCIVWAKSYLFAEIFGTSEDDAPDMDNTADSDNADEIANLKEEAQALKRIRESMGSEDFARMLFEKVFTEDVKRLRSMEDMWKHRKPPEPLDFAKLTEEALGVGKAIADQTQSAWTLAENLAVFSSSIRKLSNRLEETRANADTGNATPVLSFDKDDKDILDFVTASSNLRSTVFDIERKSEFELKQMAGNIIPAIATTNAIAAGLSVLQAFKVMREDYDKARMVFLANSSDRMISSEPLHPPKPECPVCGVSQSRIEVDLTRATIEDLVQDLLRTHLGYGEEFSISSEDGLLFDPDLEDNLLKKLSDVGVKQDSFLTIVDEDDESPRVNLLLSVANKELPPDSKSISLPEKFEIARKPKPAAPVDGELSNGDSSLKRKRSADDAGFEADLAKKRGKVAEAPPNGDTDELIIVNDQSNGAIVIDD